MMVIMERFSVPIAVFLMGIIGAPLGSQIKARGRLFGIIISLIVFLTYYLFFAGVRSLCETGTIPPSFGMWIPDIFLLLACTYLLLRAERHGTYRASKIFSFVSKKMFGLRNAMQDGRTGKTM